MVGFSFHWVILTNIYTSKGKLHVSINDPAGKKYEVAYQNLTERDRFYIYRKMKSTPKKLWAQITKLLEEIGPLEVELAEEIMKTIKERIEMKIAKVSDDHIHVTIKENPEGKTTPLPDYLKPILKVHDETVESIKRIKKQKKESSLKAEKLSDENDDDEGTSSKSAFMKKMRKIIGENFQDNDEK